MQQFFQSRFLPLLLKASWQAGVIILLVLAAQWALGRRFGSRWRYGLWLLVVLRLALPWTIPSGASLFNVATLRRASEVVASVPAISTQLAGGQSTADSSPMSAQQRANSSAAPAIRLDFSWPLLVWLAGSLTLMFYLAMAHWRLWQQVAQCRPLIDARILTLLEGCKDEMEVRVPVAVIETALVDGPCLFGFLRPRLLLPRGFTRGFSNDELRYVFLHELGHVKRHDILFGWLMLLLQIIHWFNPLVWLAFARMRVDRELACDALALSHAEDQAKKPYCRTIVKILENLNDSVRAPGMAGIVEDKKQMKERIDMIAKFQKTNRTPVLAAVIYIGLGLLTLTDAQTADKPPSATANSSGPPLIASTSPAVGATEVDPAVKEIQVTFDQDMRGGMSWTGGGLDFPQVPQGQKARWIDNRTCVLPVKLESGHYYRVGINSTSYRNFSSAQGIPAEPSAIYFTTQGASEKLKAKVRPPHVVTFNPGNGAQDVSAGLTEVRVTFSVPMGRGGSWCTAGDDDHDFPRGPEGKHFYWTDNNTTCVLPVKLEPGMTYRIRLNAEGYINFQNEGGVPLQSVLYTFKTSDK